MGMLNAGSSRNWYNVAQQGIFGKFMVEHEEIRLTGGNMNSPVLRGKIVYREPCSSSRSIQKLLKHLERKGVFWVPKFYGIDANGKEMLSYIDGSVPHHMPDWVYDESILVQVSSHMREFHDATCDFDYSELKWELPYSDPVEVICHNDFAPYNCVFNEKSFAGLIDFDLCSPGSRLWDMAYCAYRFIPLMPNEKFFDTDEVSPFPKDKMINKARLFLNSYMKNSKSFSYTLDELFQKVSARLRVLSDWTENFGKLTKNAALIRNSRMYSRHAEWVKNIINNSTML